MTATAPPNASAQPRRRKLEILSPKRNRRLQTGWEGFFPYYAGFPEFFASELLKSADLDPGSTVLDPWNGSGTTTYSAKLLGMTAMGVDLNPVMIVIARARLLAETEADHLRPLAATIIGHARAHDAELAPEDPLLSWFQPPAAAMIRAIETGIRRSLVGTKNRSAEGVHLDRISGTAATLYVALFAACRTLAVPLRSSNPTWMRAPRTPEERLAVSRLDVAAAFAANVKGMDEALRDRLFRNRASGLALDQGSVDVRLADTVALGLSKDSVDFILTSPPYCTRIDYTAATRIELAVLAPLLAVTPQALGRQMIGSTRVPNESVEVRTRWGRRCEEFLAAVKAHPSKASAGYYYRTHVDYFDKMDRSFAGLAPALKPEGRAVFVVQDSYYKEVHNDLPAILTDMAAGHGLMLTERRDFHLRSMSDINPGRRSYARPSGATEAVLCFAKEKANG